MTPTPLLPIEFRARAFAPLPACMGGWCSQRDRCGRHHQADRSRAVERLCHRGQEHPTPTTINEEPTE